MTWREKYIYWILLIIARMIAQDSTLQEELRRLQTAISVDRNDDEATANTTEVRYDG